VSKDRAHYTDPIVFSLESDIVWASWPRRAGRVELGRYDGVTYMMRNFLAQCALGERLTGKGPGDVPVGRPR